MTHSLSQGLAVAESCCAFTFGGYSDQFAVYTQTLYTCFDSSKHYCTVCLPNIHLLLCRLVPGGLAESTGLLAVNDEVLEVNGIEVAGKSLDQVRASLRQFRICASVEEVL